MSLTSYRAAPPRVTNVPQMGQGIANAIPANTKRAARALQALGKKALTCEWVSNPRPSLASMPGDDLLFQRLSVSTIGAVRFHGRVRDGIGWVTDAMVTKQ